MYATQVVLVYLSADRPSQVRACYLDGPKMYPAVDARVGDIICDLLERRVLQNDGRHRGIGQRDRVSRFSVKAP